MSPVAGCCVVVTVGVTQVEMSIFAGPTRSFICALVELPRSARFAKGRAEPLARPAVVAKIRGRGREIDARLAEFVGRRIEPIRWLDRIRRRSAAEDGRLGDAGDERLLRRPR